MLTEGVVVRFKERYEAEEVLSPFLLR
jgi:hypothetical protein